MEKDKMNKTLIAIDNRKGATDINGTCLQGYVNCTYDDLLNTFGKPTIEGGMETKIEVEWELTFIHENYLAYEGNKEVATIYNWKNGIRYCGEEEGLEVKNIKQWNIGGHSQDAVQCVMKALEKYWKGKK